MSKAKPLKVKFEAEVDGKAIKLAVVPPSAAVKQHGRLVHAKAYNEAVKFGAMIREDLDIYLRKEKKWDDDRQAEYDKVRKSLLDGERRLARGGIRLKEARQLALDMAADRDRLRDLLGSRNGADSETADAIADQSQFNFMVAACTVYDETGKPFFSADGEHSSTDVYLEKGTEPYAFRAADKLAELLYGSEKDMLGKLPENQFLRRFKFVDDDLHLVDDRGRRVDEKGRLVDDKGRFINDKGEYIDADGNRVDEAGRFVVEEQPFLDDDGRPIDEKSKVIFESANDEPIQLGVDPVTVELTPPASPPKPKPDTKGDRQVSG